MQNDRPYNDFVYLDLKISKGGKVALYVLLILVKHMTQYADSNIRMG